MLQDNLNNAIRGYGTDSKEAAAALRDFNSAQANVTSFKLNLEKQRTKHSFNA